MTARNIFTFCQLCHCRGTSEMRQTHATQYATVRQPPSPQFLHFFLNTCTRNCLGAQFDCSLPNLSPCETHANFELRGSWGGGRGLGRMGVGVRKGAGRAYTQKCGTVGKWSTRQNYIGFHVELMLLLLLLLFFRCCCLYLWISGCKISITT